MEARERGEGLQWLRSILETAGISHCLTVLIDLKLAFFTKTVAFLIIVHILPVCPGACFYCSFHLMLDLGYNFVVKFSRKGVGGQWFCRTIYTYFNGIHSILLFTMKFKIPNTIIYFVKKKGLGQHLLSRW